MHYPFRCIVRTVRAENDGRAAAAALINRTKTAPRFFFSPPPNRWIFHESRPCVLHVALSTEPTVRSRALTVRLFFYKSFRSAWNAYATDPTSNRAKRRYRVRQSTTGRDKESRDATSRRDGADYAVSFFTHAVGRKNDMTFFNRSALLFLSPCRDFRSTRQKRRFPAIVDAWNYRDAYLFARNTGSRGAAESNYSAIYVKQSARE